MLDKGTCDDHVYAIPILWPILKAERLPQKGGLSISFSCGQQQAGVGSLLSGNAPWEKGYATKLSSGRKKAVYLLPPIVVSYPVSQV